MTDMMRYNAATELLANQVQSQWLNLPNDFNSKYDMVEMVCDFRAAFCNKNLRRWTVNQKYENARIARGAFSAGFCGIASYTWNHLFRMPDGGEIWRLKLVNHKKFNHVWLENKFTGQPLDLTFDQFIDDDGQYIKIPYDKCGTFTDSNFDFERAYVFARGLGINLKRIAFINALSHRNR